MLQFLKVWTPLYLAISSTMVSIVMNIPTSFFSLIWFIVVEDRERLGQYVDNGVPMFCPHHSCSLLNFNDP